MIHGPPRIYPIFDPTCPEMGKTSQSFFYSFFCNITLAATSLKTKLFEYRKFLKHLAKFAGKQLWQSLM